MVEGMVMVQELFAMSSSEAQVPGEVMSVIRPASSILKNSRVVLSTVEQAPLQDAICMED